MNILYNGTDITSSVQPITLHLIDNAAGKPDGIHVLFSDTEGLWSQWRPAKNDTIQVREKGYDTGLMYIDELTQGPGVFELKALSIPQESKTARTQGWENVRFLEIVTQIAARYGFMVQTYNIVNHLYERVDQQEDADFSFLAYRCMLEGCALKINNRSLVIYDEATEEQKAADPQTAIIRKNDIIGGFQFKDKSTDIYAKCLIRSQTVNEYIQGEFAAVDIHGPTLTRNIYASNQAEANRWARGLLRSFNKHMITAAFAVNLNTAFAAGTNVEVRDTGMFDGKYIIDRLIHDPPNSKTKLWLRRPLEGY